MRRKKKKKKLKEGELANYTETIVMAEQKGVKPTELLRSNARFV